MTDFLNNSERSDPHHSSTRDWKVVAHDIRNILAVIKTEVEIALMGTMSDDDLRDTLVRINEEADKISAKLNEG